MKYQFIQYAVLLAFALSTAPALARDITREQQAAYDARLHLEQASADLEDTTKQIEAQNKLLEREQARLKALQDKQVAAQKEVENAKADLAVKTKILDEAWEQRDK